jgi:hemerythrin superfamily protein
MSMSILRAIEEDHRKVEKMLSSLKSTTAQEAQRRQTEFGGLQRELHAHMKGEEELLFPLLLDKESEDGDRDEILEMFEEHNLLRLWMDHMSTIEFSHPRWGAKMDVVAEVVDHHHSEEEEDIFPVAREHLDAETLEALGHRFGMVLQEA